MKMCLLWHPFLILPVSWFEVWNGEDLGVWGQSHSENSLALGNIVYLALGRLRVTFTADGKRQTANVRFKLGISQNRK